MLVVKVKGASMSISSPCKKSQSYFPCHYLICGCNTVGNIFIFRFLIYISKWSTFLLHTWKCVVALSNAALARFFSLVLEVGSSMTQEKVFWEETLFSVECFVADETKIGHD